MEVHKVTFSEFLRERRMLRLIDSSLPVPAHPLHLAAAEYSAFPVPRASLGPGDLNSMRQ